MKVPSALQRALGLGLFTGLFSLGLAWSSRLTAPLIEAQERNDRRKMLAEVIPAKWSDRPLDENVRAVQVGDREVEFFLAERKGELRALAFQSDAIGYSGVISILVGVKPDGTILGVRVISHTETPGLGDRIEAVKSDWILGFDGKSLNNPTSDRWLVKKDGGDFDALSGATITPRAVVRGVKEGLERFERARPRLVRPELAALASDDAKAEPSKEKP